MKYVFDTSGFIVLGHYYPKRFPSFWEKFNGIVSDDNVVSVREVFRELDSQASSDHLQSWIGEHEKIFLVPSPDETEIVSAVFSVPHFQYLVTQRQRLKGMPVADPFVVASAMIRDACVVTEEAKKKGAARIPNVCEHFYVDWTNVEGFMEREGWTF